MSTDVGHLCSIGKMSYEALVKVALSNIAARFADDDVNFKVAGGESSRIVRAKIIHTVSEAKIVEAVIDLCTVVAVNGYRVVGKNLGPAGTLAMVMLGVKIGGKNKNKNERGYTMVATLAAFPDICAEFCFHAKTHLAARVVGGYKFTGSKFPPELYLNGTHALVIDDKDDQANKRLIGLAILAHQGCYISSRALAGSKGPPEAPKIKSARKKQLDFILTSGNAWPSDQKDKVFTRTSGDRNNIKNVLIGIGKQLPQDIDLWATDAKTFMDSFAGILGWTA